jgi:chromatin structure-remodeling complex subunit SFH1
MADGNQPSVASTSNFQTTFGNMTDSQLRETLTQISNAANRPEQFQAFASPIPQSGNAKGWHNYACNMFFVIHISSQHI